MNALAPQCFVTDDEPLFASAREAVRFASARVGSAQRAASSRMLDASLGGRVLAGLDGVAQAGMILNALEALGPLAVACMVASSAPRTLPCYCRRPCCSGQRIHAPWRESVHRIAQEAEHALPKGSRHGTYVARSAIVVKIYSGGRSLREIGEALELDADTVSLYHRAIHCWLMGRKAGKWGPAVVGVEPRAWEDAETVLRNVGIVGSPG